MENKRILEKYKKSMEKTEVVDAYL